MGKVFIAGDDDNRNYFGNIYYYCYFYKLFFIYHSNSFTNLDFNIIVQGTEEKY